MKKKKKKTKIEYRYYQAPADSPMLALLKGRWRQECGSDIECLHFHNYLEIGYCYKGEGILTLGEEDFPFQEGNFSVIPKNYPHMTISSESAKSGWEYLFIDLEGFMRTAARKERAERIIERIESRAMLCSAKKFPELAEIILLILNIMRSQEEYYLDEAKGILAALLIRIARNNKERGMEISEPRMRSAGPIYLAMEYIHDHYMENIRIDTLAERCHISQAQLRRLLSSYIKMSPTVYINTVRIKMACEYLQTTDEPISDIAHKCGFFTLSTFNRNFKKYMGISPRSWRDIPENYERQLLKFSVHFEEGW